MKLLVFIGVVVVATVIVWLGAAHVIAERHPLVGDVEWPGGGTLRDFPREFPNVDENESATRLLATAARVPENELRDTREAMNNYIRSEIGGRTESPAHVPDFLAKHSNVIAMLRAQIITNPAPMWARDVDDILEPPMPPLMLHMRLFATFASDALAHRSDGAVAWSDLHAAWILARSLWRRPEMMSVIVALSGTRTIVAVASKLPPPRPSWWQELVEFDVRKPFVRSLEYDAWASRLRAQRYPAGEPDDSRIVSIWRDAVAPILRPIRAAQANDSVARYREVAGAFLNADACNVFRVEAMPDMSAALQRVHRFEVEREGVNALLALEEKRPMPFRSICRQAQWTSRRLENGGTELAFTGHLPPLPPRVTAIPLVYQIH